jgi:hypothetical protein
MSARNVDANVNANVDANVDAPPTALVDRSEQTTQVQMFNNP